MLKNSFKKRKKEKGKSRNSVGHWRRSNAKSSTELKIARRHFYAQYISTDNENMLHKYHWNNFKESLSCFYKLTNLRKNVQ